jgi:hypothetical protein
LSIDSKLSESLNNQATAMAGWNLSNFKLSPIAVPEPTSTLPILLIGGLVTPRRKQIR